MQSPKNQILLNHFLCCIDCIKLHLKVWAAARRKRVLGEADYDWVFDPNEFQLEKKGMT